MNPVEHFINYLHSRSGPELFQLTTIFVVARHPDGDREARALTRVLRSMVAAEIEFRVSAVEHLTPAQ